MSVVDEGFICPYCLVGFGSSGKLQSHFVEMHSGSENNRVGWEEDGVGATAGYEPLRNEVSGWRAIMCNGYNVQTVIFPLAGRGGVVRLYE